MGYLANRPFDNYDKIKYEYCHYHHNEINNQVEYTEPHTMLFFFQIQILIALFLHSNVCLDGDLYKRKGFWTLCLLQWYLYIEGILPKGSYLPCVSMAGRALLAGYHRSKLLGPILSLVNTTLPTPFFNSCCNDIFHNVDFHVWLY